MQSIRRRLKELSKSFPPPENIGPKLLRAAAQRTIQGYESMHMIRKGQARWVSRKDVRRQVQFINKLFELAA